MSDTDDMYDRKAAADPVCAHEGHDWSHSADRRVCRRCGVASSYGAHACHGGHDWCHSMDLDTCRRCGATLSYTDRQRIRGY